MNIGKKATSAVARLGPRRLGRRGLVVLGTVGLIVGGGGVALAQQIAASTPISSGIIHGCYSNHAVKGSRVLALQNAGSRCPKGTTAITWNQKGPRGAVGRTGSRGPAGPAGTAEGVATSSGTSTSLTTDPAFTEVLVSSAVPATGTYYLSATINVTVGTGDTVICAAGDLSNVNDLPLAGETSSSGANSIPVNMAVQLNAGDKILISCAQEGSSASTFDVGYLTASFVANSNPSS